MNIPPYISPTQLHKFEWSRRQYALEYLMPERPPPFPQTVQMATGSCFDAYVKSWLHAMIYGPSPEWSFEKLFEQQVEPQCRDKVRGHGAYLFGIYKDSGALGLLVEELLAARQPPQFEFKVRATVGGVPLLGKPDLFYIDYEWARVTYDWKVEGFHLASNKIKSPNKGFSWCWDMRKQEVVAHKQAGEFTMEQVNPKWADQLAMYSWLKGQEPGEDTDVGIDQFCGPPQKMRIARHRSKISMEYQLNLLARLQAMWHDIINGEVLPKLEFVLLERSAGKTTPSWM